MKKLFLFLVVALTLTLTKTHAQYVYKIKADSLLVTNDSCTAELNLENSTKNVKGFLYNKGNGRTEFRKAELLSDSTLVMGGDTFLIRGVVPGLQKVINADNTLTQHNEIIAEPGYSLRFVTQGGNIGLYQRNREWDESTTQSEISFGRNSSGIRLSTDSNGCSQGGLTWGGYGMQWYLGSSCEGMTGFDIDVMETRQWLVRDDLNTRGMLYAADYSLFGANSGTAGHEGERWIPDLGYVRRVVSDSIKNQKAFLRRIPVNNTNYNVQPTDHLVAVTSLTAPRTITLPFPVNTIDYPMENKVIIIKDESGMAGTHNITVKAPTGGFYQVTIDGVTSKTINTNYGVIEFYSNGTQWFTK